MSADESEKAAQEAQRRHPEWHDRGVGIVQGSHWRSGFIAGAEWALGDLVAHVETELKYWNNTATWDDSSYYRSDGFIQALEWVLDIATEAKDD